MHTLLAALGGTALAGTITLLLGGLALLLRDRVRTHRRHQPPMAPSLLVRELGVTVPEDYASGTRRLVLLRHGTVQDEHDAAWRSRLRIVERALDEALLTAGYDDGTYTALVLRHTAGPVEHGRQQCWRIPGPHADAVLARVERQLTEYRLGSPYSLRTDAHLTQ